MMDYKYPNFLVVFLVVSKAINSLGYYAQLLYSQFHLLYMVITIICFKNYFTFQSNDNRVKLFLPWLLVILSCVKWLLQPAKA